MLQQKGKAVYCQCRRDANKRPYSANKIQLYGGGKLPKVFPCDYFRVDLLFCYIPQIRKANSQGKKDIIKPKQHRRDSSKAICHFLLKTCVRVLANKMRFDAPLMWMMCINILLQILRASFLFSLYITYTTGWQVIPIVPNLWCVLSRVEKNALKFLFIMLPFSSSVSFAYLVANICDSYGFYAPERQGKLSGLDCLLVHCKFLVLTYQNWFPMPLCLISDTHICVCTHKYTQMAFEHEVFGIKHDICFLVAPCTKIPCFYLEMLFWE